MPPKRRGRKAGAAKKTCSKKDKDPFAKEKKIKRDSLLKEFDQFVENHCNLIKSNMVSVCSNIQVLYDMALLSIPPIYHNMTKAQYEEKMKTKFSDINKIVDNGISKLIDLPSVLSRYESFQASTAKKKQKFKKFTSASKVQKKYKDSVDISIASTRSTRRALAQMQETVTPVSRQHGLPQNFTPKVKKSTLFKGPLVVTPKFDPRKPWGSSLLRKPKAGEIVMSMSGSPLLIPTVDVASKPGIMVSLGGGRVMNVADPSGLSGIEMNLDHTTKQTLKLVNEKLSKVLAS